MTANSLDYLIREIPRWRAVYNWDKRLEAYDAEVELRLLRDLEQRSQKRQATYNDASRSILEVVAEWIERFNQRVNEAILADPDADPLGIVRAIDNGQGLAWLDRVAKVLARVQQIAGEAAPIKVDVSNAAVAELITGVFKSKGAELDAILDATAVLAESVESSDATTARTAPKDEIAR